MNNRTSSQHSDQVDREGAFSCMPTPDLLPTLREGALGITPMSMDEVFAVNHCFEVSLFEMDGARILTVDNFYKNPHLVREYLSKSPAPVFRDKDNDVPEDRFTYSRHQHLMPYEAYDVVQRIVACLSRYYLNAVINAPDPIFRSNVFQIHGENDSTQPFEIHHDGRCVAASVFLNTDDECSGGTAFFRHLALDRFDFSEMEHEEAKKLEKWHESGDAKNKYFAPGWENYWKMEFLGQMKFNRLIMYKGGIFHSAYFDKASFKTSPKISQIMFFTDVSW